MATKQQSLRLDYLLQASNNLVSRCPTLSRFYMQHYQETLRQNDLRASRAIDRLSCPRCGQIYLAGYNASVTLTSPSSMQHDNDDTTSTIKAKTTMNKKKKKKDQKNILVYTCHACHHRRKFNGSFKRHIPTRGAHTESTTLALPTTTTKTNMPYSSKSVASTSPSAPNTSKPAPAATANQNKDAMRKNTAPMMPSNKRPLTPTSSSPNQQQQPLKKKSKSSKKNQLQSLLASRKDQNSGGGGSLGLGDFLSSL